MLGNMTTIPISHYGSIILFNSTQSLHLHKLLLVQKHENNLILVKKLYEDNKVSVEFLANSIHIKNLITQTIQLIGGTKYGLYKISSYGFSLHKSAI